MTAGIPGMVSQEDMDREAAGGNVPPHDKRGFGESRQAYHAFCHYRDMGAIRTIQLAYLDHREHCLHYPKLKPGDAKPLSGDWRRWSSKWKWIIRTDMRDTELDKINLIVQDEERENMSRRHAAIAVVFMDKVQKRLESLNPEELSPREMAQWYDVAAKIERLSRGDRKSADDVADQPGVIEIHSYENKDKANAKPYDGPPRKRGRPPKAKPDEPLGEVNVN